MPRKKTREEFIQSSLLIHGDRYIYDKVIYLHNKAKVEIICKEHGSFFQTPNDHTGGHNCSKCSLESHNNYNLKELKSGKLDNILLDLYVIELSKGDEKFIKVGITKEYIKRWRNIKTKSGYEYNKILLLPTTSGESIILEKRILTSLKKQFRYIPKTIFPGYKECLLYSAKEDILNQIINFLTKENHRSALVGKILDYEHGK